MLHFLRNFFRFGLKSRQERFAWIYERRFWKGSESLSGEGSSFGATETVRKHLPGVLERHAVSTMLDAGCGDLHWMSTVELGDVDYLGVDIVDSVVAQNNERYGGPKRRFEVLDLVEGPVPQVDLVLCRDVLYHLCFADSLRVLENLRASGSKLLLATTYPQQETNRDIITGAFAFQNLERPPFNLPPPVEVIEDFIGERLALWRIAEI